jgi:hypothetical protein
MKNPVNDKNLYVARKKVYVRSSTVIDGVHASVCDQGWEFHYYSSLAHAYAKARQAGCQRILISNVGRC